MRLLLIEGKEHYPMNQHNGLRRKLEKYAIPNLTLYLIICYGIGYLMQYLVPAGYQYLMLDPFLVLKGQVWRLVTWILIPPDSSNIFFVLITLYLYYSLGGLLERIWGTYKYNVYLFSGLLFTILGAFVLCGYSVLMGAQPTMYTGLYLLNNGNAVYFGQFSTYYINMSIFLACAASIPDVQVLLMFIFPIKVKWLGIVYGIILLVNCICQWGRSSGSRNFIRRCGRQGRRKGLRGTNARSAAERSWTETIWNSVSAPSVTATTNIVSIICLRTSM